LTKVSKRIVIALAALVVAYYCVAGALYLAGFRVYRIPTAGMEPTIRRNEMVVGRLSGSYRNRVQRMDLAIYRIPQAPGEIYVKRVAALGGEQIVIDQNGMTAGGKKTLLPHPVSAPEIGPKKFELTVPAGSIFLVGDNTSNSMDSRYHGPVPLGDVLGYLVFKP